MFTKVLITGISMIISILAYILIMNVYWAIGIILLTFVHEMGHMLASTYYKNKSTPPIFIPFVGAMIGGSAFKSQEEETVIGYGGPFLGTIGAFITLLIGIGAANETLVTISLFATIINLFNLLPVRPFDGGRITSSFSKSWIGWLVISMLLWLGVTYTEFLQITIFTAMLASTENFKNLRHRFYTILTLGIVMTTCIFAGLGNSEFIAVEIVRFTLCHLMVIFAYQTRNRPQKPQELINTPLARKIIWFSFYIGLIALLICMLYVQVHHIDITK